MSRRILAIAGLALALVGCASEEEAAPTAGATSLLRGPGLITYPDVKLRAVDEETQAILPAAAAEWDVCGARRAVIAAADDADPQIIAVSFVDAGDPLLEGAGGKSDRSADVYGGQDYAHVTKIHIRHETPNDPSDYVHVMLTHEIGHALISWRSDHWGNGIMQPRYAGVHHVAADDCAELVTRTGSGED